MIAGCGQQLRAAFGGAFGLDFGAIMQIGSARGADLELLADVLPQVEAARLAGLQDGGEMD